MPYETIEEAALHNPAVYALACGHITKDECILALVNALAETTERNIELINNSVQPPLILKRWWHR